MIFKHCIGVQSHKKVLLFIPENRPLTNHVDDGDHDDHYDHDLDDYADDYDVVYQALEVLSLSD